LGAAVRHVGVATYGSRSENLPAEGALGADYRFGRFAAAADVVFPFSNLPNARVGIEYSPVREAALRMGWRSGPYDIATLGPMSGLTAGLGLTLGRFGVDYAFVPYGKLGATHRIGLRATVERPRTPEFGSLDIVLVDARAGFPVAAFVTVAGLLDTSAITERLKLGPLRPGRLVVKAVASGYVPRTEQLDLVAGRDRTVTLKLEKVKFGDVAGGIYDAGTKRPVGGRIVYRGVVYGDEVVNPAPGTFRLRNLPAGDYRVGISGPSEDYIPQSCTLTVAGGATLERDFFLVKKKQTIVLEGINFETGKAEILAQSGPVLDRAGQILKQTADVRVELAGHTDAREINTKEFPDNWALSQARAEAVRKYLIDKWGIAPDRLTARGYADTQPLAGNDTPEGMARNRRTEFRILE
jgi:outer membrane protein OmpA-like peptidoglycan-associated protein